MTQDISNEGYNIDYDFSGFRKIADLIYFEGPFLSHYVSSKGDDYLFYWVDRDDSDKLPEDYLPETDSYYAFTPIPTDDAEELMTYERTGLLA